jgi:hypothetical protein
MALLTIRSSASRASVGTSAQPLGHRQLGALDAGGQVGERHEPLAAG